MAYIKKGQKWSFKKQVWTTGLPTPIIKFLRGQLQTRVLIKDMTVSSLYLLPPQYKVTHKTHTGFIFLIVSGQVWKHSSPYFSFYIYKASFLQTQADIDILSEFISPGFTDYS